MEIIRTLNAIFWQWSIILLLLGVGIFYTIILRFPQVTHFKDMFRCMFPKKKRQDGISPFATLCTAVGGQVGTGVLAGVATAIASGGPGAVFWMWIIGIIGMATSFAENTLAQIYKVKNPDGTFRGGPPFYLAKGLKCRPLALIFSIVTMIDTGMIIAPLQINSIANGFHGVMDINLLYVGIAFSLLTGLVIFGGIKRLSTVASYVVPFMAVAYLAIALICLIINIKLFPDIIKLIVASAFGMQEMAGGTLGYTVQQAFHYGSSRGLFSNEAGQGSSPAIHAAANVSHPAQEGFVAMFGVFLNTLLICTATSFMILLTGANADTSLTGINLTQSAFNNFFGAVGPYFILVCICLFAWTSCLADIFYGETSLSYLCKNSKSIIVVYRVICLVLCVAGAVIAVDVMWELADFFNALMVLTNITGVLLLAKVVRAAKKDYEKQRAAGIEQPTYEWKNEN